MESEAYIQSLIESNSLRESTLCTMVRALELPEGSRGLDAGCGIGLQCLLLAEEVGPAGHVTGLDISKEMLNYGSTIVKEAGMLEQISFQEGDVSKLPFDKNTFVSGNSSLKQRPIKEKRSFRSLQNNFNKSEILWKVILFPLVLSIITMG